MLLKIIPNRASLELKRKLEALHYLVLRIKYILDLHYTWSYCYCTAFYIEVLASTDPTKIALSGGRRACSAAPETELYCETEDGLHSCIAQTLALSRCQGNYTIMVLGYRGVEGQWWSPDYLLNQEFLHLPVSHLCCVQDDVSLLLKGCWTFLINLTERHIHPITHPSHKVFYDALKLLWLYINFC